MDISCTGHLADCMRGFVSAKPLQIVVDGDIVTSADVEVGDVVTLKLSTKTITPTPEAVMAELEAEPVPIVPRNRKPPK